LIPDLGDPKKNLPANPNKHGGQLEIPARNSCGKGRIKQQLRELLNR
jgi:hypothetical protein